MGLFDVHAHVTHADIAARETEVFEAARRAGVTSIISNGLNPTDNEAVRAVAARAPDLVRPAYGFYPVDTVMQQMDEMGVAYPRDVPPCTAQEGIAWVRENASDAFAIGEIGLDGHWVPKALWEAQEDAFRELAKIAIDANKPMILHTRKRERRVLEILDELGAKRVDWHCFGGKVNLAREVVSRGHWLSIPSNARRHEAFTRMLETLPRDRILLETDCPYLGPEAGQKSEPAHVALTAAYAAQLWKCSEEQAHAQLEENFEALFGAKP